MTSLNLFSFDREELIDFTSIAADIAGKIKFINEDIIQLGLESFLNVKDARLYINFDQLVKAFAKTIALHREKMDMLDKTDDRIRFLDSEVLRLEKKWFRDNQEHETAMCENYRLKDTIKNLEKNIENLSLQLKSEKTAKRVADSNYEREKNSLKSEKFKLEKEFEKLKERLGKLLSEPKKQYSLIDTSKSPATLSVTKSTVKGINEENSKELDKILLSSTRNQLQDVLMENRELRQLIILHMNELEMISGINGASVSKTDKSIYLPSAQRNNSFSAGSDSSQKSDETFVIEAEPDQEVSITRNDKLLMEMPFHLIHDSVRTRFMDSLICLKELLTENAVDCHLNLSTSNTKHNDTASSVDIVVQGNMNRLQKEIFQLRKQISDYEELIQGKDELIEGAIQQRVKRGSLLPTSTNP